MFEKFTSYFDETISNLELNPTLNAPPSAAAAAATSALSTGLIATTAAQINIESAIIRDNLLLTNTAHSLLLKANKRIALIVSDVIKLIGNNHKLYQSTLSKLNSLYLKTRNWFYSTLRSQLLVKLNELHNHDLIQSIVTSGAGDSQGENIYKFASIINMCLKEKRIDTKRAKELETIMDSKKFEKIIAYSYLILFLFLFFFFINF